MRIFVGLNYGRDHETEVCGASDCREDARRFVELARNQILYWAREAIDGPDGSALLDDHKGDLVGQVMAFDVAGSAKLQWKIAEGVLCAKSTVMVHSATDDTSLTYSVFGIGNDWKAEFDGRTLAHGSLEHCMAACRKAEDDAIQQAIENQKEHDESWPRASDYVGDDKHGRLLWLLQRMLNPEDLGRAVQPHVRDEVRDVLGMRRCESSR
jgi:hypothetical protein